MPNLTSPIANFSINLDTIIDSFTSSVFLKDENGVYLLCNAAFVSNAGFKTKQDVIGKTDQDLWPEYADQLRSNDQKVMALNKTIEILEHVKVNTGKIHYCLSTKSPIKNEDNKIIGIFGNTLNVTEIEMTKQKLAETIAANNTKMQFLLDMQHDIKGPVSSIFGLTEILASSQDLPDKIKEYISHINVSSKKLLDFMTNTIQFYEQKVTEIDNYEGTINLQQIIQNTIELHLVTFKKKNLEIIVEHGNGIPNILLGNSYKLQKILMNLVDNALKFTDQGTIKITTKICEHLPDSKIMLSLSVEDTGIGIPAAEYDTIFNHATQLSSDKKQNGFGLGLWMVKKLIEEIGGKVSVESKVGVGTKFNCIFPCKINTAQNS